MTVYEHYKTFNYENTENFSINTIEIGRKRLFGMNQGAIKHQEAITLHYPSHLSAQIKKLLQQCGIYPSLQCHESTAENDMLQNRIYTSKIDVIQKLVTTLAENHLIAQEFSSEIITYLSELDDMHKIIEAKFAGFRNTQENRRQNRIEYHCSQTKKKCRYPEQKDVSTNTSQLSKKGMFSQFDGSESDGNPITELQASLLSGFVG